MKERRKDREQKWEDTGKTGMEEKKCRREGRTLKGKRKIKTRDGKRRIMKGERKGKRIRKDMRRLQEVTRQLLMVTSSSSNLPVHKVI